MDLEVLCSPTSCQAAKTNQIKSVAQEKGEENLGGDGGRCRSEGLWGPKVSKTICFCRLGPSRNPRDVSEVNICLVGGATGIKDQRVIGGSSAVRT